MKLFLCSGFLSEEIKNEFELFAGVTNEKKFKIACITTGAEGYKELCKSRNEIPDLSWLEDDISIATEYGYIVDKYDIAHMMPQQFSVFDSYNAIWVEGGLTGYLINQVRRTTFEIKLTDLLKTKLYIGTSAGSMICSKSLDASEWYIGEPEKGIGSIAGLGYIDFQIYPHFDESNLPEIISKRHKDQEYWLLKNGQAISVQDNQAKIHGGEITILKKEL